MNDKKPEPLPSLLAGATIAYAAGRGLAMVTMLMIHMMLKDRERNAD